MTTNAQRATLAILAEVLPADAYLAGGVAVAAHFRHRTSRDLDVFTVDSDPAAIAEALRDQPSVVITTRADDTLYLEVGRVPVSILRHRYPLIGSPTKVADLPVPVASVADLTAMKIHAIASRGAARDFWDLHVLIRERGISLADAIAEHSRRYPREDTGHVLKSLAYFGDAEASPLPRELDADGWARIRADFEGWVRET